MMAQPLDAERDLAAASAATLATLIRSREVSAAEVVDRMLERIRGVDPVLNACTVVLDDSARESARHADRAVANGDDVGPLHGVPVAIKDAIWVEGQPSTMGTRALEDFRAPEDASAVGRLRNAGAIILAKTTNSELLWDGYTRTDLHGVTRNPWDTERTPGGSSGGSGAAVAAGMAPLALGTDAGGSIRLPAAFCGIVGIKPTHGTVARTPGFDEMRSLNAVGPLARSMADARLCLRTICGPDPADNLSGPPSAHDQASERAVQELRIAWTPTVGCHEIERSTKRHFEESIEALAAAGLNLSRAHPQPWDLDEMSVPIFCAELGTMVDGREARLSGRAAQMLDEAASVTGREYYAAQVKRAAYTRMWEEFFAEYDAILTPTTAMPPFAADPQGPVMIGGKSHDIDTDTSYFNLTLVANLTGGPAISVPTGLDETTLPLGIQVMTKRFADDLCARIAEAIEALLPAAATPVDPPALSS